MSVFASVTYAITTFCIRLFLLYGVQFLFMEISPSIYIYIYIYILLLEDIFTSRSIHL